MGALLHMNEWTETGAGEHVQHLLRHSAGDREPGLISTRPDYTHAPDPDPDPDPGSV